jgi:hypothetical protein
MTINRVRSAVGGVIFSFPCVGNFASAQEQEIPPVNYPVLPAQAAEANGFVPQGWLIDSKSEGDLNKDGLVDILLVLRGNDPKNVLKNQGYGASELDTNPRMIAVAFAGGEGKPYTLALQNHTLIPRHEQATLDDPFDNTSPPTIARGAFSISLGMFANAGGWDMSNSTLTFRYQNSRFELIGFEESTVRRNTGAMTNTSANFATGKIRIDTGNIQIDKPKTVWKTLPKEPLLSIDEVGDGLNYYPLPQRPEGEDAEPG